MERLGLLGGTFDPVHHGHLAIAEEARVSLGLDRVLFVPAARQPLKALVPAAEAHHRLAMLRLACAPNPAFAVSTIELDRPPPSYTVATLEALQAPDRELCFVIGTDALALLPRWRDAARIPALARIVAVGRPGAAADLGALIAALPGLAERLTRLDGPDLAISSSALRRRVAAGLPIRYLVPDAVAAYIAGHGLYRDA